MVTVLVVDDDPHVRFTVRAALEGAPPPGTTGEAGTGEAGNAEAITVVEAADGERALLAVTTEDIDVVLLDVMMPGLDGMAVLEAIRRHDDGAIAVIMLTARGRESDVATAYRGGADAYLTKPFDVDELVALTVLLARSTPAERRRGRRRELERAELLLQLEDRFGDLPLGDVPLGD